MPWIKGQSGNPRGTRREKGSLTAALAARVDKDALADRLVALTTCGDLKVEALAIRYIYDRLEGAPRQQLQHSGDPKAPLIHVHHSARDWAEKAGK